MFASSLWFDVWRGERHPHVNLLGMTMVRGFGVPLLVVFAGLGAATAQAEVGKATAGPGEWFMGVSAGGGASWGPNKQAFINNHGDEVYLDEGSFFVLGLEAGYVLENPSFLFDRVELATELRGQSRSLSRNPAGAALQIIDPNFSATVSFGGNVTQAEAEEDEVDAEVRLSFKNTVLETDTHVLVASFEPFYRLQDTDGKARLFFTPSGPGPGTPLRRDNIDADYYGAQAAIEMETPLTESMSLVGRASAGAYYVDADTETDFAPQSFGIQFTSRDSDSTWGGRFGGALGIKVPLHYAGASITLLGTIDYLTDVATIDHANGQGSITETGFDDALEVGGKFGLIIPFK